MHEVCNLYSVWKLYAHLVIWEPVEWATLVLGLLHSLHALPQFQGAPLQERVYHRHLVQPGSLLCKGTQKVQDPNRTQLLPVTNEGPKQVLTAGMKELRGLEGIYDNWSYYELWTLG